MFKVNNFETMFKVNNCLSPNHSGQVTTWWQGCCPVSRCQGDASGAGDPQVQSCVRHLLPTWLARINRAPLLDGDDCADLYIVYTLLICGQRLARISDHWPWNWQLISILIMLLGRMWCQFCQGGIIINVISILGSESFVWRSTMISGICLINYLVHYH